MRLNTFAALSLTLVSLPAFAVDFTASMSGAYEVPPNASPASGFSTVTVDGDSLTVDISWSGLTGGAPSAAHIHCCVAPGANVGVAVGLPSFPATASGSYSHTFDLLDPAIYAAGFRTNFGGGTAAGARDALIAGMMGGLAYTNIHNATYPGGEIRGLLVQTTAGTTQVSGIGVFNPDCQPPVGSPPVDPGDYDPIELTGSLHGCWYTYVSSSKFNRSGTYQETGTEIFVGCFNGACGTFETTYTFTAKYVDETFTEEIHGRCHHPIVGGTGGFAGAKGVINFKDDVVNLKFDYKGHISLE